MKKMVKDFGVQVCIRAREIGDAILMVCRWTWIILCMCFIGFVLCAVMITALACAFYLATHITEVALVIENALKDLLSTLPFVH